MKAILVTVDDSIEVIELKNGEESIKEIVGGEFDQFDLFSEEGSGVDICCNTSKSEQREPNKLATLIWTDFLNGKKERAYEENAVREFEEEFKEDLGSKVDENDEFLRERINGIKKGLVAKLRYKIRTSVGAKIYGDAVICMENEDLPGDIIQKIMDVASQYTDKYPAIEKPVETQVLPKPEPEEKIYTLLDAVQDNNK